MVDVDWVGAGFESHKLSHLAMKSGFFYPEHDAMFDCLAAVELLAKPLSDGTMPLRQVLVAAAECKTRIHAEGTPFAARNLLKQRGYQWLPPTERKVGCWWLDVRDGLETRAVEGILNGFERERELQHVDNTGWESLAKGFLGRHCKKQRCRGKCTQLERRGGEETTTRRDEALGQFRIESGDDG